MAKLNIGVAIGRFQIPAPHNGHRHLFQHILDNNDRLVILLGCSVLDGYSAGYELTFNQRSAIMRAAYPDAIVLPLHDCPTNEEWSMQIDHLLTRTFPQDTITLYGGRASFTTAYNGTLNIENVELVPVIAESGTEIRAGIKEGVDPQFFSGQIYALQRMWPISFPTADVALIRPRVIGGTGEPKNGPELQLTRSFDVFMIQRSDSGRWCFPGGFVDPSDASYSAAAARELMEETGLISESPLQYVTDMKINDWRYRGSRNKIHTMLFTGQHSFGTPKVNPNEVQDYQWATPERMLEIVSDAHRPLAEAVLAWWAARNVKSDKELTLIREAVHDASLSDGTVRCIAAGLEPPTDADIARAVAGLK